jgi:hypothetical protein
MSKFIEHGRRSRRTSLGHLAGLALIATVALVAAGIGTAAVKAKPAVTAAPTISGTSKVGETLTANNGTWSGGGTMTFTYQWRRCDKDGGSCSNISGATEKTYVLKSTDMDNTLRVIVTAQNAEGSTSATTVPTAVVGAAATGTGTTPTPATENGCPKTAQANAAVSVSDVSAPARLQLDQFQITSGRITAATQSITVRFHVGSTCGNPVKGANLLIQAVPFNQFSAGTATSGDDGWATMTMNRQKGFPAASKQQLLVLFGRASKAGEPALAGNSTRRLVSLPVALHG